MKAERRDVIGLALIALAVFLPEITWGLPHATSEAGIRGWDVDAITGIGPLAELHNLLVEAKPDWYVAYPLFHYVLLAACAAPYMAWLWLTGGIAAPSGGYPYGFEDPVASIATLALIGRLLTLAMAVGTVIAAYAAARIAWDRRAAWLASLAVMLSGPMLYRARTGNLDVPVLFWTALGVVALALAARHGLTLRRAAAVGACAALATATKDQAYGGWVAAIATLALLHGRGALPAATPGEPRWQAPAAMLGAGAAVYALAGGILFWPGRFLAHMEFILGYEEARFRFAEVGLQRALDAPGLAGLALDLVNGVGFAFGPALLVAAVAGLVSDRLRGNFERLLVAMLAGYALLIVVPIAHVQYRYTLLPCFLLAFPAARWLAACLDATPVHRRTAQGLIAASALWLGFHAANLTWQQHADARRAAGAWIAEHAAAGDAVAYFGDKGQLPALPAGVRALRLEGGEASAQQLRAADAAWLLVVPDYTSPPGVEHSLFLAKDAFEALESGELPYAKAARFETRPWLDVRYPFVNPPVRVYHQRRRRVSSSPISPPSSRYTTATFAGSSATATPDHSS